MEMKESWLRATDARTSRRTYLEESIDSSRAGKIQAIVDLCNAESGLQIRFVKDGAEPFKSFKSSYGMFHGVKSYFAMAGDKKMAHLQELIGYYGELIVLECTALGLGTCWISGTYDKSECGKYAHLSDGEELTGIITVGCVKQEKSLKEKVISATTHSGKKKSLEEFITPSSGLPDWVVKGVEAVGKAPSAINKQPEHFTYESGVVKASVDNKASHQGIDLGIARAHFELGAWGAGSMGKWVLEDGDYLFK